MVNEVTRQVNANTVAYWGLRYNDKNEWIVVKRECYKGEWASVGLSGATWRASYDEAKTDMNRYVAQYDEMMSK